MKREKIVTSPVEYEETEFSGKKIARIQIFSFTENCYTYFKEALSKADENGIKNIIIDLRNNGGGYLTSALQIADEFLPEGKIMTVEDHRIDLLDVTYESTGADTDYNIVILINGMSASASELLSAALKENEKATIIGEKSFGKGTVQTLMPLKDGGVIKFTTAYYLTPSGKNINKVGINPDMTVENSFKNIDMSQFKEFNYRQSYKLGDRSDQIQITKEMLSYLGIFVGEINDEFDENLKAAVYTFQEMRENLYPYGVLDKTTQLSLYTLLSELKEEVDDQLQAAYEIFE